MSTLAQWYSLVSRHKTFTGVFEDQSSPDLPIATFYTLCTAKNLSLIAGLRGEVKLPWGANRMP